MKQEKFPINTHSSRLSFLESHIFITLENLTFCSGDTVVSYWLDLFTGTTWKEFRDAGACVSGFRTRRKKSVQAIQRGDILLCYLTGVMRWVGALEVIGPSRDTRTIWNIDEFPERLDVRPLIILDPEYGVQMDSLFGKVEFYKDESDKGYFKGFLRGSL